MRPGLAELEAPVTLEDLIAPGSGQDDTDPRLSELVNSNAADDEFAKLTAELPPAAAPVEDPAQTCHREQERGPR